MIAIGVDPGVTGAITVISSTRGLLACQDIPVEPNGVATGRMMRWVDARGVALLLSQWASTLGFAGESVHAFIERPIAMPNLPASTIASQFDTFGALRALLSSKAREVRCVNPKDWKAIYGLKANKDAARACALRLYPAAPVSRAKDHNRADSLLIAHYGMREVA